MSSPATPYTYHTYHTYIYYTYTYSTSQVTHWRPSTRRPSPSVWPSLPKRGSSSIDDIQKLHIRTVPLGEQPRRLCHVKSKRAFV